VVFVWGYCFRLSIMEAVKDSCDDAVAADAHEGEGFFGSRSDAFEEPRADHSETAMQPYLDVFFCEIEGAGGFGGAEFFEPLEEDWQLYCDALADCDCSEPGDHGYVL
jgi:hypothetical protein